MVERFRSASYANGIQGWTKSFTLRHFHRYRAALCLPTAPEWSVLIRPGGVVGPGSTPHPSSSYRCRTPRCREPAQEAQGEPSRLPPGRPPPKGDREVDGCSGHRCVLSPVHTDSGDCRRPSPLPWYGVDWRLADGDLGREILCGVLGAWGYGCSPPSVVAEVEAWAQRTAGALRRGVGGRVRSRWGRGEPDCGGGLRRRHCGGWARPGWLGGWGLGGDAPRGAAPARRGSCSGTASR